MRQQHPCRRDCLAVDRWTAERERIRAVQTLGHLAHIIVNDIKCLNISFRPRRKNTVADRSGNFAGVAVSGGIKNRHGQPRIFLRLAPLVVFFKHIGKATALSNDRPVAVANTLDR